MGLMQALVGVGAMVYPLIIEYLMSNFGFRGSLYVIAGINGNVIVGMLVMHPVTWHMKRPEEPEPDEELDLNVLTINITPPSPIENRRVSMIRMNSRKGSQSRRRGSSIPEFGNWSGPILVSDTTEHKENNGRWQILVDFLDLPLLSDLVYVNILVGISFVIFSDLLFYTILPMYLIFDLQFNSWETAQVIGISASADLLSRTFLALSSTLTKMKSRNVYLFGVMFTIVARFGKFYCSLSFNLSEKQPISQFSRC